MSGGDGVATLCFIFALPFLFFSLMAYLFPE